MSPIKLFAENLHGQKFCYYDYDYYDYYHYYYYYYLFIYLFNISKFCTIGAKKDTTWSVLQEGAQR